MKVYIAEKTFSVSLYNLIIDTSSSSNLNPKFLRDYMSLPDELYSIKSASAYQRFIDNYGTHFVSASEFGGKFEIQVVSKSTVFDSFKDFDSSAKTEAESMEGTSTNKKTQQQAAQDTTTGSRSGQENENYKTNIKGEGKTENKGVTADVTVSGGTGSAGVGGNYGTDSGDDSSEETMSGDGSLDSTEDENENSSSEYKETGSGENNSEIDVQTGATYKKARDFRESQNKQKSVKYKVEGGTDLEFTHRFYTREFPYYFTRWLDSVILDPKSFDYKVKPISDLLMLDAFDFFPQCTNICSFGAVNCEIKYDENKPGLSMPCDAFEKLSSKLHQKHSTLKEALKLYENVGKLTPANYQTLKAGPKGCSEFFWNVFENQREYMKSVLGLSTGNAPSFVDLKNSELIEIDFSLPAKLYAFRAEDKYERDICNGDFKKEVFYHVNERKYVKYDSVEMQWMECSETGICDDSTRGMPDNEISSPNMICLEFVCFEYDAETAEVYVNQMSKEIMFSQIEAEKNDEFSKIAEFNYTRNPNCKNEQFIFKFNENVFVSKKLYSSFISIDELTPHSLRNVQKVPEKCSVLLNIY